VTDHNAQGGHGEEPSRRDFVYIAATGAAAVGGGLVAWPFISQMLPAADTRALATVRQNIGDIEPGQQITIMWRGGPVFIRRGTESELAEAAEVSMSSLPDQEARNENLPDDAPADSAGRVLQGGLLVMKGNCTHLGCVPVSNDGDYGEYGGWFCPCHGSHYDQYGRIRRGPAPENLHIPPVSFASETEIVIG
jgi:ubiquinol-cytochrome c reductase iron-sulfur subunit